MLSQEKEQLFIVRLPGAYHSRTKS